MYHPSSTDMQLHLQAEATSLSRFRRRPRRHLRPSVRPLPASALARLGAGAVVGLADRGDQLVLAHRRTAGHVEPLGQLVQVLLVTLASTPPAVGVVLSRAALPRLASCASLGPLDCLGSQ